ncbi:MAG TPA: uroporphyrinogen decarboxylase family protein [Clostridia bacterium]|mgnify:CR=1 FL=1|jgi:uroporphyrinogen-III decarboxylase|nr:uroporphyrinogen decarboxylase family protein [Clostridia bacterium]HPZ52517.1 uroporphyrinogen decarboxylase family protein [Clostridia bacterium]
MTIRENVMAILNYEKFERMPIIAFGYWAETVDKWAEEGHISKEDAENYKRYGDNGPGDKAIMSKLGFDYAWNPQVAGHHFLYPAFETTVLEVEEDGSQIMRDSAGLIVKVKPGVVSIPSEIGTTLTDREAWEEHYLPKLQYTDNRVNIEAIKAVRKNHPKDLPFGIHCGSLMGNIRNMLGVLQLSYLYVDDEDLYTEIIDTFGDLCYKVAKRIVETGIEIDYAHFWEDICYKNGPLVTPSVFEEKVGPHYKRITDLLKKHNINIVSLDCDGCIDSLVPIWVENGVNTMFPIEVGTWKADIRPWREKYGKELRGIGGMNKNVFAMDKKAVEEEVERLKALVSLGGYIPCPDHRIPPTADFSLVAYYCELMAKTTF